ncbi:MAG: hypothetical protein OFPI_29110 [Osedax symbiont Rs2]|nr:MAG: hypothetical protein OFPI_29110 [Osedax symbiont Rs2]
MVLEALHFVVSERLINLAVSLKAPAIGLKRITKSDGR